MNESKLRAIHRILKHTHADLGDALSPFFDDARHGPAIVTAARSLYDALDELEAVIVAELGKLAQAERARAAAEVSLVGRPDPGATLKLCAKCGELATPARIPGRGLLCVKCGEAFARLAAVCPRCGVPDPVRLGGGASICRGCSAVFEVTP